MAEIDAKIENGRLKGEITIWPSIVGGAVGTLILLGLLNSCQGSDNDLGTYKPSELHVTDFSPRAGIECTGLSPEGTNEVIASTVVCKPVEG